MSLKGIWSIVHGVYVLARELLDEAKRERTRQRAAIASKEAAIAKAVAHQRAQEKAAISHKVTPLRPSR